MRQGWAVAALLGCMIVGGCSRSGGNVQGPATGSNAALPAANASAASAPAASNMAGPAAPNGQEMDLTGEGFSTGQPGLHHANQISFGQARDLVVQQVSAILGAPSATGRSAECPSGPVDTVSFGALDLNFEDGRFAGWVLDGSQPALETYHGLAVGMPRSDLTDELAAEPVTDSSLGSEVMVNGVGALLGGPGADARVSTLFAGVTCFAR